MQFLTSDETWARRLTIAGQNELLVSDNAEKTRGFEIGMSIVKPIFKNTNLGVGLSANYFDIDQSLDRSVHLFESGEEVTNHGLSQKEKSARFLAPGLFLLTDLSFPIKKKSALYLRQKINWIYLGNQFESSFWKSWVAYTVYGGLKLEL